MDAIDDVLVGCGAGPGAKAQPDPVKIRMCPASIGRDRQVSLGDKFSGEELTYTATSSNEAVATVEVDNAEDILTVTAVGAVKATITVTAADPRTAQPTRSHRSQTHDERTRTRGSDRKTGRTRLC